MNILIPDSWLRDFVETKATAEKIAEALTLCSASVEKVEKVGSDYVYNIEVTTNRIDAASVLGIAREAAAILPRFDIKARLKTDPYVDSRFHGQGYETKGQTPVKVEITDSSLCPRFTAILLEDVSLKPSPSWMSKRLEMSGVRALNNVVDVSNYVMLELGQPMHTFDYKKILGQKMIMRQSRAGEKLITLDGVKRDLPQGALVIEDGKGRLIDLCGIMGAENSAVDEQTKKVLLFVQTYDPVNIRRTCQKLTFRTEAAVRFEKGLDPQLVLPALNRAVELFKKLTGAKVRTKIIDIYPQPYKPKNIQLELSLIERVLHIQLSPAEIKNIFQSLGFQVKTKEESKLKVTVPSWRANDISLPEDLIEEIGRIYGYHNLQSFLPSGQLPQDIPNQEFTRETKTKTLLKDWGFTELYTYSLVSQKILENCGFDPKNCLKIANPLTEEWEYLRPSLIPGILKVIEENLANFEKIKVFELSKSYLPKKGDLPHEKSSLTGAVLGESFSEVKGTIEALLGELGIGDFVFEPYHPPTIYHPARTAEIVFGKKTIGVIGEIHPITGTKFNIDKHLVVFDLDFEEMTKLATSGKIYVPLPKYPSLTEDLALIIPPGTLTADVITTIQKTSPQIKEIKLLDIYQNTKTFRLTYQSRTKTLTRQEAEKIRKAVLERLAKLGVRLKS